MDFSDFRGDSCDAVAVPERGKTPAFEVESSEVPYKIGLLWLLAPHYIK